jgi:hypothetical protein
MLCVWDSFLGSLLRAGFMPTCVQFPCSFDVDVLTAAQCMEVSPVIDDFESDLKGRDVYLAYT